MTQVTCCPEHLLPNVLDPGTIYFTTFERSTRDGVGHLGLALPGAIRRARLAPSAAAWDFATVASAVDAADKAIPRKKSADGWTRMIDLDIYLVDPTPWCSITERLESLLRFLTGDFWALRFQPSGMGVPRARRPQTREADCVCLLSGGVDSLVGAIDQIAMGKAPILVSHRVRGSGAAQRRFASVLGSSTRHFQWSFTVKIPGESEKSTRARSIVFFALAVLAASGVPTAENEPVEIIVPENGFISLNIPLGPGRIGSLSSRTTHPIYMSGIQTIWNTLGINAQLSFPYRGQTKGELLMGCADQNQLAALLGESISCGKYQRHKLTHCGECVPCLIRRAAFLRAGLLDTTAKGYCRNRLQYSESQDVAAAAAAYLRFRDKGVHRFVGGALSFASHGERTLYEGVFARGMKELGQLLTSHGVI